MPDEPDEPEISHWSKYRSEWWTRYFNGDLAHFWPPQLDASEPDDNGYRWITRDGVFAIAASESEHRELHTAVAAYVWGIGKNAYSVGRLVRAFTTNTETVEQNLRAAAAILAGDGSVAAYESMLDGGVARTRFMGPAYFTKFLFFIGYRDGELAVGGGGPHPPGGDDAASELRPLILDKWVATALRARGVFGLRAGDGDWPSALYSRYLVYCHEVNPSDPEAVEAELFNEGRDDRNASDPEDVDTDE